MPWLAISPWGRMVIKFIANARLGVGFAWSFTEIVKYKDPQFGETFVFKAVILQGAKIPAKVLKPGDWERGNRGRGNWRPQLGFNSNRQQVHLDQSAFRALGHSINRQQQGGGQYSNAPPPGNYHQGNYSRPPHSGGGHFSHSRQQGLLGAPPPFNPVQQYPRQQYSGSGGHGWDRSMQSQGAAYQQNMQRGGHGGGQGQGGYHQQRGQDDRRGDRRDDRGGQPGYSAGRNYPLPPPARRYNWS